MKHLHVCVLLVVFVACIANAASMSNLFREKKIISQVESHFIATRESKQLRGAVSYMKSTTEYSDDSLEFDKMITTFQYDKDGCVTKHTNAFIYKEGVEPLLSDLAEEFTLFKNKSGAIDSLVEVSTVGMDSTRLRESRLFEYSESGLLEKKTIKLNGKPEQKAILTSKNKNTIEYQIFFPSYKGGLQHKYNRVITCNKKGEITKIANIAVNGGIKQTKEYTYNSKGDKTNFMVSTHTIRQIGTQKKESLDEFFNITFLHHTYDAEGNWTKATVTEERKNGKKIITSVTREIEYYK